MDSEYQEVVKRFAEKIISKDFIAAQEILAPWLQKDVTSENLAKMINKQVGEIIKEWESFDDCEIKEELYPCTYELGFNSLSLQELKDCFSVGGYPSVAQEVNDSNFVKWVKIQFQPSEDEDIEIDAYMDFWVMVVKDNYGYKIGYFRIEDPD